RSGLVEIWKAPFNPVEHPARLFTLLGELAARPGVVNGQNVPRIVEHLQRTFRTGQLTVNPGTQWVSTASFVKGELSAASHLGASGAEALKAMILLGASPWSFTELGGADGDGVGVVLELSEVAEEGEEIALEPADEVTSPTAAPATSAPEPGTPILLV